jgi:ribosome-associated protein
MTDDTDDDAPESRRQLARRERRVAGDRSARLAAALMKLPAAAVPRLGLDDDLRDAVDRARAVTSPVARRRAERALAGELRRADLDDVDRRLAAVHAAGGAAAHLFKQAERWRARLLDEGPGAAADLPGGAAPPLPELIERARRERDTGRPPGAARALFRHVLALLERAAADGEGEG